MQYKRQNDRKTSGREVKKMRVTNRDKGRKSS